MTGPRQSDDILSHFHNRHQCAAADCSEFGDFGRDRIVGGRRVTVWWCVAHRPDPLSDSLSNPARPGAANAVDGNGQQRLI